MRKINKKRMTEKEEYPQHPVYDKNSIEFVTVAAQFCSFVENCQQMSRGDFFDKLPKLLSLLYLKTAVVPTMNDSSYSDLTQYVTEESYEYIQMKIKSVIGRHDEYLDVFVEDMQYSDTPILCNISEDISDIYQDLKDMICNFQTADIDIMNDSLKDCIDNFKSFWGQKLLNALRALHNIRYSNEDFEDNPYNNYENNEHDFFAE